MLRLIFIYRAERNVRITKLKIQFRRHFAEANNYVTRGCVEGGKANLCIFKKPPSPLAPHPKTSRESERNDISARAGFEAHAS